MGKSEFMSPKDIANRMKAKGLQKLRFYCQMCQKQCRDANGFKCHCLSESHLRQMSLFAENPTKYMESFSDEFLQEYVALLSRRYNTMRVSANQIYQELIADRNHLHMNATQWDTLTDFVKHLGRNGIAHVDETPRGWFVAWIDNSPEALERQAAIQKKERSTMDDEQREQKRIQEQIVRAQSQTAGSEKSEVFTELKRTNPEEKVKLNITLTGPTASSDSLAGPKSESTPPKSTESPNPEDASSTSTPTVTPATKFSFGSAGKGKPLKKATLGKNGFKALINSAQGAKLASETKPPTKPVAGFGGASKRTSAMANIMQTELARKAAKNSE